ncbi:hypothetical protein GVX82_01670 [Patescibacteria group bacterium]|jgi:hypothetical protein|nr:hypothetical protein [Patescibacteria group bacterium]
MPPRTNHSFDAPGFLFAVQFCAVVLVMVVATHVGVSALAESWFAQDDQPEGPPERPTYALVPGVAEIGSPFVPAITEAAAPTVASVGEMVPEEGRFIGVDLDAREVRTYQGGQLLETYPILKLPAPGTHWEPPGGSYEVIERATNHRSRVGDIALPYTVEFFGTFFIHGWPYRPGGETVPSDYPGGGITLSSRDAQEVFSFARLGTPLYVHATKGRAAPRAAPLSLRGDIAPPTLGARAWVVTDLTTGEVLAGHNEERALPIASITKLMTAVVAGDMIHPEEEVYLPYKGVTYRAADLLYPLMLRSDNAVSNALANHVGWDTFLRWMNDKADALGMQRSAFRDPSGLSAGNVASPNDLVRLARYLYTDTAYILAASKEDAWNIRSSGGSTWRMTNQNRFAGDAYFVGGKLGFTDEAKKTGLSILAVPVAGDVRITAVVILGSDDWKRDTDRLVAWLGRVAQAN